MDKEQAIGSMRKNVLAEKDIDLNSLLTLCSGEVRRLLAPLLNYEVTHQRLSAIYRNCKRKLELEYNHQEILDHTNENGIEGEVELDEKHKSTKVTPKTKDISKWEINAAFLRQLESFDTKEKFKDLQKLLSYQLENKIENMDPTMRPIRKEDLPSWISHFQEQVDYIPGRTSGKKVISSIDMQDHLQLAERCKSDGNKAYQTDKDWELALTRYTQGVETLNKVTCIPTQKEMNKKWLDLYTALLSNQASAALQLKQYRLILAATTECYTEIEAYIMEYKMQHLHQMEIEKKKEAERIERQNSKTRNKSEKKTKVIEMNSAQEFDLSEMEQDISDDDQTDDDNDNMMVDSNEANPLKHNNDGDIEFQLNLVALDDDSIVELLRFGIKVLGQRATAKRYLGEYELAIVDVQIIKEHHNSFAKYIESKTKGAMDKERKTNPLSAQLVALSQVQEKYAKFLKASKVETGKLLNEIKQLEKKEKIMGKKMFSKKTLDIDGLYPDKKVSTSSSKSTSSRENEDKTNNSVKTSNRVNFASSSSSTSINQMEEKNRLSLEEVLDIQGRILAKYKTEEVTEKLNETRRLSEYETSRYIQRLRNLIPTFLSDILNEYSFSNDSTGYKQMDTCISKYISKDARVKENARKILSELMGDMEG